MTDGAWALGVTQVWLPVPVAQLADWVWKVTDLFGSHFPVPKLEPVIAIL